MGGRLLSEAEGYQILQNAGINVPEWATASTKEEAVDAAEKIGYPVVCKISSPDISHKSEVGGVITGITDREMLQQEYDNLLERVRSTRPDAQINGVLIVRQVQSGTELFIGGTTDPSFGKVLSFGTGGTLVELWKDISLRLLPVDQAKASAMIDDTRISAVIAGFRGTPPLDREALTEMIVRVAAVFEKNPDIQAFDINPFLLYESGATAVDARFIIDDQNHQDDLTYEAKTPLPDQFFSPHSIAVVGASATPGKIGYFIVQNLLPFEGPVYPVNPHNDTILGKKCFSALSEIPETPDWVIISVPAQAVPTVMEDAGRAEVKFVIIISAGFRETGSDGAAIEKEIQSIAAKYGIRFAGPNCLGLMLPHQNINATFAPVLPRPGPVAFISQSGAIISAISDWEVVRDIGASAIVSVGNQANLTFIEYLQALTNDLHTKAVVLYIEELTDGSAFIEAVKKIIKRLPVIALKSGRSQRGQRAALSHTGSLAGSWEVYKEAFRETGIITAYSLKDAFETAGLLASEGWPQGNRAVVVTSAGGFAVLSADYAEDSGVHLIDLTGTMLDELNAFMPQIWSHENPIDMIGDAGIERYAKTLDLLIRHQDQWDITYVAASPTSSIDSVRLAKEIVRFSTQTEKMVVGCLIGGESMRPGIKILHDSHVPNFSELSDAFGATGLALQALRDSGQFNDSSV